MLFCVLIFFWGPVLNSYICECMDGFSVLCKDFIYKHLKLAHPMAWRKAKNCLYLTGNCAFFRAICSIYYVPEMCWLHVLEENPAGCFSSRSWFSLSSRGKAFCWSKPMIFTFGWYPLYCTRPYSLNQNFPHSTA